MAKFSLNFLLLALMASFLTASAEESRASDVADSIALHLPTEQGPVFSPDRQKFALVSRQGDLANNLNHYDIRLFDLADLRSQTGEPPLARFSSSSNREGVADLEWLDNFTIRFMAEQPGQARRLFSLDVTSGESRILVEHEENLIAQSSSKNLDRIVFTTPMAPSPLATEAAQLRGLVVGNHRLLEVIADPKAEDAHNVEIWVKNGTEQSRPLELPKGNYSLGGAPRLLSVSPDGKSLLLSLRLEKTPEGWLEYDNDWLKQSLTAKRTMGAASEVLGVFLVDLDTSSLRPLIDAPFYPGGKAIWSPDSRQVAFGRTFPPLAASGIHDASLVRSKFLPFTVDVASGRSSLLSDTADRLERWEGETVVLRDPTSSKQAVARLVEGEWESRPLPDHDESAIEIAVEQSPNNPPQLWATPRNGERTLLLDFNPGLSKLRMGEVRDLKIPISNGRTLSVGLFLPPDYKANQRYPLVVQTHGWEPEKFWPDGYYPCTTGYAAQALCGRGVMVVQIGGASPEGAPLGSPGEGPQAMTDIEDLVAHLESEGMVDGFRVGLMGWSRTVFHVKYTLTQSTRPYKAALLAEGIDAGYWQYIGYGDQIGSSYERMNGGFPYGKGLDTWAASAPGFRLDKVRAPVMIHTTDRSNVLPEWEWYAGLRRLGKPVEMVSVLGGSHNLVQPRHRLISQGLALDWFCFWLLGEEDPDPAKVEQYGRWRELRQ